MALISITGLQFFFLKSDKTSPWVFGQGDNDSTSQNGLSEFFNHISSWNMCALRMCISSGTLLVVVSIPLLGPLFFAVSSCIYSNLNVSKFPYLSNLIFFYYDVTPITSLGFACSFLVRVTVSGMLLGSFSMPQFILSLYGIFV
jgi:hypothetical protein